MFYPQFLTRQCSDTGSLHLTKQFAINQHHNNNINSIKVFKDIQGFKCALLFFK